MQGSKRRVHEILGPINPKTEEAAPDQALTAIFEELAEAVKIGDAKAGVAALKAFISESKSSEASEE